MRQTLLRPPKTRQSLFVFFLQKFLLLQNIAASPIKLGDTVLCRTTLRKLGGHCVSHPRAENGPSLNILTTWMHH
jgi:hypothetical protein